MMKQVIKSAAVIAAGLMMSSGAFAAVDGYYADGGFGWTHSSISTGDTTTNASSIDKIGMGYKFGMGFQTNQNFAVEGQYVNFGSVKYKSTTASANGKVKTSALMANIKGILPLADQMSANVKVGVFRSFVDRESGMSFDSDAKPESAWGFDYAIGGQYDLNPYMSVGVNWLQLLKDPKNSLLSVDLSYHFS